VVSSRTSKKSTMTQLTKEAGQQLLTREVYAPVFFQKLAAHGIVPQSEPEAQELLSLATDLRVHYEQHQQKTASDRAQQLRALRASLNGQSAQASYEDTAVFTQLGKQAAATPDIFAAALVALS